MQYPPDTLLLLPNITFPLPTTSLFSPTMKLPFPGATPPAGMLPGVMGTPPPPNAVAHAYANDPGPLAVALALALALD